MTLDTFPSPNDLKGTVLGTLLYLGVYFFALIPFQSFSKIYLFRREKAKSDKVSYRAIKYYNSKDRIALTGDRAVGNFGEFAILFLPLLWIHAIFVDPSQSLMICVIYTITRALYPIVFYNGSVKLLVLFSTGPGYLIYSYLFASIFFRFVVYG